MRDRCLERGYSLPELVTALGIAALIIGSTAVVVEGGLRRWRVHASAGDVASTLLAARARAALEAKEIAVVFDTEGGRWRTMDTGGSGGVAVPVSPTSWLPRGVAFATPDGSEPVSARPPGTSDTAAVFGPRGLLASAATPAFVAVGDPGIGVFRRVRVSMVGAIALESWNGSAWR